eukprot:6080742-Alexandrium_andersonii.AAC.1
MQETLLRAFISYANTQVGMGAQTSGGRSDAPSRLVAEEDARRAEAARPSAPVAGGSTPVASPAVVEADGPAAAPVRTRPVIPP